MKISLSPVVTFRANPNDPKNPKNRRKTGNLNESGYNQNSGNLPLNDNDPNSPLYHSRPFIPLDPPDDYSMRKSYTQDSGPHRIRIIGKSIRFPTMPRVADTSEIPTMPRVADTSGLSIIQNSGEPLPRQSKRRDTHDTIVTQTMPVDVRSTNVSNLTELQNQQAINAVSVPFDRRGTKKSNVSQQQDNNGYDALAIPLHESVFASDSDSKSIPVIFKERIVPLKYNYENLLVQEITNIYPQYFNNRPEPVFSKFREISKTF